MRRTAFKSNLDVVKAKGVIPYWEIAIKLNIHQNTLMNWLRKELEPEKKAKVLQAIKEIEQEDMLLAK